MKRLIAMMAVFIPLLLAGVVQADLYYPHVDTNSPWATEIAIINTSDSAIVAGTLRAYGNNGQELESMAVSLAANGRREIDVAAEFGSPNAIGYLIFETTSTAVCGYTKLFVEGTYRAAVPAVQEVNSGDVYLSHIASNDGWWTGVSILNTTGSAKTLTFQFNDGQSRSVTLAAGEHQAFTVASLFAGVAQPTIGSAVITNGAGTVGLELFGSTGAGGESYLSGILLKDDTTSSIFYPHVTSDAQWWTGIVAYNPSAVDTSITITPYRADGVQLTGSLDTIPAGGKYIGVVSGLGLPAETAWLEITSASPITGFELFGTMDGSQLAGYTGVGISRTGGVFAKVEKDGWTGIAFVNIEDGAASVTLTAYDDSGAVVATEAMNVNPNAKVVDLAENIFSQDISAATRISFSSDREVVGFQLNGSTGGMMLDGLPAMAGVRFHSYEMVADYPHDPGAFTQGLVYYEGYIYESTGKYGTSSLREIDLATGDVLNQVDLDSDLFGEGLTILGSRAYQLTWLSGKGFVYDIKTLELLGNFTYSGEGWGLTTDGIDLIMSDGSSYLRFIDPETFEETQNIEVLDNGEPVDLLNELEYINGEIYANIWTTDMIARIDPTSGEVLGWIDLAGLLGDDATGSEDVLNGIAYDSEGDQLFVTGKLWPKLYEIVLVSE